jgi:hypothetical protein
MSIGVTLGAGTMFKSVYDPDLDDKFGFPEIPSGMDVFWQIRSSAADNEWYSVTYGNGLFVAVASGGVGNRVMTSPDGITWTIRSSAADNNWRGVTYGNGLFVAVATTGTGNKVMTSPDGITWTIRSSAADNYWYSVTYSNGLFVAVASGGVGNRVMTLSVGEIKLLPGTLTCAIHDAQLTFPDGASLVKKAEFIVARDGEYRVTWQMKAQYSGDAVRTRVYKNGVAYGAIQTNSTTSWVTKSEDLTFEAGDLLQLYGDGDSGGLCYAQLIDIKVEKVETLPTMLVRTW